MPTLRALAIDDEPLAIERILALCSSRDDIEIIGAATNGLTALTLIETLRPDLILLDINMPEMDGMSLARKLAQQATEGQPVPAIIFITAYDNFALEAFDTTAADYLLKPVSVERLGRAIGRVASSRTASALPAPSDGYAQEFWVPHRSELIRVPSSDIERVEAERDYMRLHVAGRSYLLHQTITTLSTRLDPDKFIRIHRSSIVRKDRIASLGHDGAGSWHADLVCGTQLRVGRTYLSAVKAIAGK